MINKLSLEQELKVKEYYQYYLNKGLSTQSANRPVAEKAVKEMYKLINEKEPKCIWVNSPTELIKLFKQNNLWNNLENNLRNNLRNNLWNNLRNNLENNLENNLWNNLENNLENNLWNNLENNLRNNLWNNLENNLWNNLENNLWNNLENNLWNNLENNLRNNLIAGQFYSPWIGFYEYGRKMLCLEYSKEDNYKLDLWIDMLECSYFITLKDLVILMDHPKEFHIDNKGYTHNGSNHAIKFRDGTGIYVLHGQEVSEKEFKDKEKLLKENKISKLEYLEKCYNERILI